jgi:hypothetical protein
MRALEKMILIFNAEGGFGSVRREACTKGEMCHEFSFIASTHISVRCGCMHRVRLAQTLPGISRQ